MQTSLIVAGLIFAGMIFMYFKIRSDGKKIAQNDTLKKIDEVQDVQAKILLEQRTPADTAKRLRDGTF